MADLPATTGFDYQPYSTRTAKDLRDLAVIIRGQVGKQEAAMLDIGRQLAAGKDMVGHGNFKLWVEREVGLRIRTAERLMKAAALVDTKCVGLTHFGIETLYELSAPSTPPELVDQIAAEVESGQPRTDAEVKAVVRGARALRRQQKQVQQRLERRRHRKLTRAEVEAELAKEKAAQAKREEAEWQRRAERDAEAARLAKELFYSLTREEVQSLVAFMQAHGTWLLTRELEKLAADCGGQADA